MFNMTENKCVASIQMIKTLEHLPGHWWRAGKTKNKVFSFGDLSTFVGYVITHTFAFAWEYTAV